MEMYSVDAGHYITDQQTAALRAVPFGRSTVGDAGCELIACYNALAAAGRGTPFDRLLDEAAAGKLLWRRGRWGMRPGQMKKLLRAHGLRPRFLFGRLTSAESRFAPGDMVILTAWNRRWWKYGLHSYLCLKQEAGWLCLNDHRRALSPTLAAALCGRKKFSALIVLSHCDQ